MLTQLSPQPHHILTLAQKNSDGLEGLYSLRMTNSLRSAKTARLISPTGINPFPCNSIFHNKIVYATSSTTPPASVIFRSASLLNHLARTRRGTGGRRPLPNTLLYPRGRRSRTGTVSFFAPLARYSSRFSAGMRDQSCGRRELASVLPVLNSPFQSSKCISNANCDASIQVFKCILPYPS